MRTNQATIINAHRIKVNEMKFFFYYSLNENIIAIYIIRTVCNLNHWTQHWTLFPAIFYLLFVGDQKRLITRISFDCTVMRYCLHWIFLRDVFALTKWQLFRTGI